jgi:ATP:ADP antiporter, AAA family
VPSPAVPASRGTYAAAATAAAVIAQQVAGKSVRDALFLSTFHATVLPVAMAASAFLSLGVAVGLARLMARYSPAVIMPALFAASAFGLAIEWAIGSSWPRIGAVAVYFHTALFGPSLLTAFWSFINERFDPYTAKAAVARIGSGATLGGVLGGLAAWRASSLVSVLTVVLLLAGVNAACLLGILVVRGRTESRSDGASTIHIETLRQTSSTFGALRSTAFLRNLALLVAVGAAMSSLLDYVFSVEATAAFGKGQPLLAFFSLFWLAVSVVSFLLQLTLGRLAMEKLSLATNIAILPGIITLGGAVGIAVPGLISSALLRGSEAVQRNTLFRSAYELLYTPLDEDRKRITKAVIDVAFDRLGTLSGSGIALVVVHWLVGGTNAQLSLLLGVVVLLALATFPVTRALHTGYVVALETGLREGEGKLEAASLDEKRSRVTNDVVARDELIDRVEALRGDGDNHRLASSILRNADSLLSRAEALLAADSETARQALEDWTHDTTPLTGIAVLLLAHKTLAPNAHATLGKIAAIVTGQLIDALLDPEMDFVVRRRIPRVLATCPTQRSADGLLFGVTDERFEIRYECGRALLQVTDANPEIIIVREKVFDAIRHEVQKWSPDPMPACDFEEEPMGGEWPAFVSDLIADRRNRRLEHVFAVLSLVLEREPLRMAFRALHHEDQRHRGTALEYLQTVLPAELRDAVWPSLSEEAPLPQPRPTQQILDELTLATALLTAHKPAEIAAAS